MCAALVGGMDRLRKEYVETAKTLGIDLKVFTGQERSIKNQLGELDMIILFTGKVSHAARSEAVKYAKTNRIPLHMSHSSGIASLRKCITGSS
ncbi:MAG: DUF2325 domain-containing protein [Desulfovibrio sp.]|jgi:hypothetical protein|nr:DUF2325 domain-containing protein [Desulfovibrio sp.]